LGNDENIGFDRLGEAGFGVDGGCESCVDNFDRSIERWQ